MQKFFFSLLALFLLTGCASQPRAYTATTLSNPQKRYEMTQVFGYMEDDAIYDPLPGQSTASQQPKPPKVKKPKLDSDKPFYVF